MQRFRKPLSAQIQHIDQRMALQCAAEGWSHACTKKVFNEARRKRIAARAGAGLGPQVSETISYEGGRGRGSGMYASELRLPVGVALAYHKDVFSHEAKDCASGDIFHFECYTVSSRKQRSMEALRRSLYRIIMHVSSAEGVQITGKRLELLRTLVTQAHRDGVTTEIDRSDLDQVRLRPPLRCPAVRGEGTVCLGISSFPVEGRIIWHTWASRAETARGPINKCYRAEHTQPVVHTGGPLHDLRHALFAKGIQPAASDA